MNFIAESFPARLFEHTGATTSGDQTGSRGRSAAIQTRTASGANVRRIVTTHQLPSGALVILLGPFAFVVRWVWRRLLREDCGLRALGQARQHKPRRRPVASRKKTRSGPSRLLLPPPHPRGLAVGAHSGAAITAASTAAASEPRRMARHQSRNVVKSSRRRCPTCLPPSISVFLSLGFFSVQ